MTTGEPADVCLILEGTYPYVSGGVSSWTHELILMQKHLRFTIVALLPSGMEPKQVYTLPPNVVEVKNVFLQELPRGVSSLPPERIQKIMSAIRTPMERFQSGSPKLDDLAIMIQTFAKHRGYLGADILLNSPDVWETLLSMYAKDMPQSAFLEYFWSWRGLFGGLYSALLFELPKAQIYHSLCTGYAGLVLARAHIETGKPCVVTEHGIYTNERRIEIASADWLEDDSAFGLSVNRLDHQRNLKDFWAEMFCGYSRLCYDACDRIITLYEGNQAFQLADGAHKDKLMVIPNGIDVERFSGIIHDSNHPPTVALIGRVVPIKDVKTFINAVNILRTALPEINALILGPEDEDMTYTEECKDMVRRLGLEKTVLFTGKVRIEDYLPRIDVIVLTSISEAQPLVLLEAGAAGIPSVATDVGCCSEIIYGKNGEMPNVGAGGCISSLANAQSTAENILKLLSDKDYYASCSVAIRARVQRYYNKIDQHSAYANLYELWLTQAVPRKAA